jgi:hypothetical protein
MNSSLKFWYRSAVNPLSPVLFLLEYSLLLLQFIACIDLFTWFIFSLSHFGSSNASRNVSISSRFSSPLYYGFLNYPLVSLWICLVFDVMSPFSSLILFIWDLSLFLSVSLAKGLSIMIFCPTTAFRVGMISFF